MFLTAALLAATMASASAADPVFVQGWQIDEESGNSDSCIDNGAPSFAQSLMLDECNPVVLDSGTVYVMPTGCDGNGEWSMKIYPPTDPICNTTSVSDTSGDDACDCQTTSILTSDLAVRVSCNSEQNNCFYQSIFMESDMCEMDTDPDMQQGISGNCMVDGDDSYKTVCNGGTASSSWDWMFYEGTTNCTGDAMPSTMGGACGDCGVIEDANDFYGENGTSAMVNCGGYKTTDDADCPMSKKSGAAAKFSGAVALSAAAAAVVAVLL